jgi:hypothetical protein
VLHDLLHGFEESGGDGGQPDEAVGEGDGVESGAGAAGEQGLQDVGRNAPAVKSPTGSPRRAAWFWRRRRHHCSLLFCPVQSQFARRRDSADWTGEGEKIKKSKGGCGSKGRIGSRKNAFFYIRQQKEILLPAHTFLGWKKNTVANGTVVDRRPKKLGWEKGNQDQIEREQEKGLMSPSQPTISLQSLRWPAPRAAPVASPVVPTSMWPAGGSFCTNMNSSGYVTQFSGVMVVGPA